MIPLLFSPTKIGKLLLATGMNTKKTGNIPFLVQPVIEHFGGKAWQVRKNTSPTI